MWSSTGGWRSQATSYNGVAVHYGIHRTGGAKIGRNDFSTEYGSEFRSTDFVTPRGIVKHEDGGYAGEEQGYAYRGIPSYPVYKRQLSSDWDDLTPRIPAGAPELQEIARRDDRAMAGIAELERQDRMAAMHNAGPLRGDGIHSAGDHGGAGRGRPMMTEGSHNAPAPGKASQQRLHSAPGSSRAALAGSARHQRSLIELLVEC